MFGDKWFWIIHEFVLKGFIFRRHWKYLIFLIVSIISCTERSKNTGLKVEELISFFKKWHHTWKLRKYYRKLCSSLTGFPEATIGANYFLPYRIEIEDILWQTRLTFCSLMSEMTGCQVNCIVKWHNDMKNTWYTSFFIFLSFCHFLGRFHGIWRFPG